MEHLEERINSSACFLADLKTSLLKEVTVLVHSEGIGEMKNFFTIWDDVPLNMN